MEIALLKKLKAAGVEDSTLVKLMLDEDQAPEPEAPPTEEKAPETPAQPEPPKTPDPDPVLSAIKELTGAIYASNIMHDGRAADKSPADLASETLAKILTGAPE